jgi:hypothetical protein
MFTVLPTGCHRPLSFQRVIIHLPEVLSGKDVDYGILDCDVMESYKGVANF